MPLDVLVVGAGPAGSVAALVLARAGVDVRLVDSSRFPRDKLCGDTLNPGALSVLDRLGVGSRVRERAIPIEGMLVTGPFGATVACDYPDDLTGAAISRRDLDVVLLEAAVAAGVDFVPGTPVRGPLYADKGARVAGVRVGGGIADGAGDGAGHGAGGDVGDGIANDVGDGVGDDLGGVGDDVGGDATHGVRERNMSARIVIAADGRRSRLAFALGLARLAPAPRRWAFGAYFTGVDGLTSRGEMHIRPDGYTGVAPLPGGLTNVCVVRELSALHHGERLTGDDVIARALAGDSGLRTRFARARQVSAVASLGPLAVDARAAGCPGLLLAGDAAGFVDPMTGDGLRFALRGGELAAEAALYELNTNAPAHERLRAARYREFSGKWRVNRALRWLVASPRGVRLSAAVAMRWSAPVRYLIGVAGDVHLARHGRIDASAHWPRRSGALMTPTHPGRVAAGGAAPPAPQAPRP